MARVWIDENILVDIATAIREKNNTLRQYFPGEMAWAIKQLKKNNEEDDGIQGPIEEIEGEL